VRVIRRENERLANVAEQWRLSCLAEKERQVEIKDDNAKYARDVSNALLPCRAEHLMVAELTSANAM